VNRSAVVFLFLSLGVVLGLTLALLSPKPEEQQAIEWLDNPRSLANFSLESEAGVYNKQSLNGRWTIVLFGYLNCPDICPTSLSRLAALAASLAKKTIDKKVDFVFVSVDPRRDSVAEVSLYVQYFYSSIRAVTGTEEQLTLLASGLGIQFKVSPSSDNYSVAHSISFSIIDPDGVFRGRFSPVFDLPALVTNFLAKLS